MNLKYLAACALIGGSLASAGCDEKPSTKMTDGTTSTSGSGPTLPASMQKAQDQAKMTVDAAQDKANATGEQAGAMAKDAGDKAASAGDAMVAQATKLYEDAKASINKADFAGAQQYVDQLAALKSKLPPDWQAKVEELTKMLTDAKSKLGNMSVPAMPK